MKYKGQPIEKPKPYIYPVVREPGVDEQGNTIDNNIYFEINVVYDYSDFDKLCPPPKVPFKTVPGQGSIQNVEDPSYKLATQAHASKRLHWMFLKSVEKTEGLEWDTVKMDDPATWGNYESELREAGLNRSELQDLLNNVYRYNSLDPDKVEEARKSFLATRAARNKQ